tara:strand:+ start:361 stop:777 length:417 start_codon:yes stop_codon:yes gene_type:complete
MIKYTLKCKNGHLFESWFPNNSSFEYLKRSENLECEICSTKEVEKSLMAPSVRAEKQKKESFLTSKGALEKEILNLKKKIKNTAEDVGKEFASEARAIHYGESADRPIYGKTTRSEAKELAEEGIPFVPLPWNDDKLN